MVIEKVKKNEDIKENITEVTIVEYPPIMDYKKFHGKVLIIERTDVLLSIELQRRLRLIGKPKSLSDLLIASICINRNEELITKDKDFLDIAKDWVDEKEIKQFIEEYFEKEIISEEDIKEVEKLLKEISKSKVDERFVEEIYHEGKLLH